MGQFFVLTVALVAGLTPAWAAFGVLAVGAALLLLEAALPRLRPARSTAARRPRWSGAATRSALLAGALAFDSPAHLAALLAAWGAVLGLAATRPGRTPDQRRNLFWLAVGFEIVGWWLFIDARPTWRCRRRTRCRSPRWRCWSASWRPATAPT